MLHRAGGGAVRNQLVMLTDDIQANFYESYQSGKNRKIEAINLKFLLHVP